MTQRGQDGLVRWRLKGLGDIMHTSGTNPRLTFDQAIDRLRSDPDFQQLILDSYLETDIGAAAERFEASAEFKELIHLLGGAAAGRMVLDLGAGRGLAARAFAKQGARVLALEPEMSRDTGAGAIRAITPDLEVLAVRGVGEDLPIADAVIDIVYARQVLHHTLDLARVLAECARVLKAGGQFIACREHVVDDRKQLEAFLENHPVHQLAANENAYPVKTYIGAIEAAGLRIDHVLGPWESVLNAFPAARNAAELGELPGHLLAQRVGRPGRWLARLPGITRVIRRRMDRVPGRLYTFLAVKPL